MKACAKCGVPVQDGAEFCSSCGSAIQQAGRQDPVPGASPQNGSGMKYKLGIGALLAVLLVAGGFLSWNNLSSEARVKEKLELAVKYLSENKYEEAILAYNEAIRIDPKNMEARVGLAQAYIGKGDFTQADKAIANARDIGSINPEQYRKLIEAYIERGKYDEAERLLAEAKNKYGGNTIIAETGKLLSQKKAKVETVKPPTPAAQPPAPIIKPIPNRIPHRLSIRRRRKIRHRL